MHSLIHNKELFEKILSQHRITKEEALLLFGFDIIELGYLANARRKYLFPFEQVGFIIDRIINYSNTCEAECDFCAYHARAGQIEPFELSLDDILKKVEELVELGGSQVMLQGGLNSKYGLDFYINLIATIKKFFPQIFLHSFSPAEIFFIATKHNKSVDSIISIFKQTGLDSIPGASDLLVDSIREKICPNKLNTSQWCDVMRSIKTNGMYSSATMTYGFGESLIDRIEHLNVIRNIQDETGILRAFIPWSFSPYNTKLKNIAPATGVDYLKIVAIARIFLDNVMYIQAGWLTEGLKLAQIALSMGANDMGGILIEEIVVNATGINTKTSMQEFISLIYNAGKIPVLRDSTYSIIEEF